MALSGKNVFIIEKTKAQIVEELQEIFGYTDFDEISNLTEAIDDFLLIKIQELLSKYSQASFPRSKNPKGNEFFIYQGNKYQIQICQNLTKFEQIDILFSQVASSAALQIQETKIKLEESLGRYKSISVFHAKSLSPNIDFIQVLLRETCQSTYMWATEHFHKALIKEQTEIASRLYTSLKIYLSNHTHIPSIWFVVLTEEEGFLIPEESSFEALAKIIGPLSEGTKRSALSNLNEYLSVILPREQLMAHHVKNPGKPLSFRISRAAYTNSLDVLPILEEAIFKSKSITVFPLSLAGKYTFFVLYPTAERQEIEIVFRRHHKEFEKIFISSYGKFKRNKKKSKGLFNYSSFGEIIGGVLKAMLSP